MIRAHFELAAPSGKFLQRRFRQRVHTGGSKLVEVSVRRRAGCVGPNSIETHAFHQPGV